MSQPDEWIQMFTLPNILIEEPVEIDGVAMVPAQGAGPAVQDPLHPAHGIGGPAGGQVGGDQPLNRGRLTGRESPRW